MAQVSRQPGTTLSDINIVPLVDVMLVLLVIFMITAPLLQTGIQVQLPKTKSAKVITEERIVITIDRAQRLYIGDKAVNIHQLGQKVLAQDKDPKNTPVYVRCDTQVPWGTIVMVMDTLRQSGINNISAVTQPLKGQPRTE
jgi:biopolymer transport protein TolR